MILLLNHPFLIASAAKEWLQYWPPPDRFNSDLFRVCDKNRFPITYCVDNGGQWRLRLLLLLLLHHRRLIFNLKKTRQIFLGSIRLGCHFGIWIIFPSAQIVATIFYSHPLVWPDLAKFHHFGKNLPYFGQCLVWFIWYLTNFCTYICNFYAIGQISIAVNGQRLKNNLAIWSHCHPPTFLCAKLKQVWLQNWLVVTYNNNCNVGQVSI